MALGDLESLLGLYNPDMVFLNKAGEAKRATKDYAEELAPSQPRGLALISTSGMWSSLTASR